MPWRSRIAETKQDVCIPQNDRHQS
jgi:hypothetical protein